MQFVGTYNSDCVGGVSILTVVAHDNDPATPA